MCSAGPRAILGYLRGLHAQLPDALRAIWTLGRVILWRWQFILVALGSATTLPWVSASSVMWLNRVLCVQVARCTELALPCRSLLNLRQHCRES
jgi:hypothetical protein